MKRQHVCNPDSIPHRQRNGGSTGAPCHREILTLTLWALHGKIEAKHEQ